MLMRYHCAYLSLRLPNTYSLSLVYDYPNSLGGVPSLISSRWPPVADYTGFEPARCCYSAVNLCILVPAKTWAEKGWVDIVQLTYVS